MPPRHTVASGNQLMVPAYLVTDEDEPDFIQWKRDHPDSFVAGTWELPSSGQGDRTLVEARSGHVLDNAPASVGTMPTFGLLAAARPIPLPDPSTISVEDFQTVTAEARRFRNKERSDSDAYRLKGPERQAERTTAEYPPAPPLSLATVRVLGGIDDQVAGPGMPVPPTDEIRTIEAKLVSITEEVKAVVDPNVPAGMTSSQLGTHLHTLFAAAVRQAVQTGALPPTVEVEQSFRHRNDAEYGEAGSIRTDVILKGPDGGVIAIWDYKTGPEAICRRQEWMR